MTLLALEHIYFSYNGSEPWLINNLNLTIDHGETLAIIGPSGCGKSTVLRLISGFERVDQGHIILEQRNITYDPPQKRCIGYLFQDFALFPHLTVAQNIGFGISGNKKRIDEMLGLIQMRDFRNVYPTTLSGGQQQRVALARALAPAPKLLLLDEPFSSLDTDLRDNLRQQIKDILKETATTSILVTHDPADVNALANRTLELI